MDQYALAITKASGDKRTLRASKPKGNGRVAYVWRMVAFTISPIRQHQCMPVTADFDVYDYYVNGTNEYGRQSFDHSAIREECKRLDAIADAIIDRVPKSEWHGTRSWARAFGHI